MLKLFCQNLCLRIFFFFFQAEDGIRYLTVTGVQTCALPISPAGRSSRIHSPRSDAVASVEVGGKVPFLLGSGTGGYLGGAPCCRPLSGGCGGGGGFECAARSEERRVGNECRTRWSGETSGQE